MARQRPRLMLCDCTGSMTVDAARIAAAAGLETGSVSTHLCRAEVKRAASALGEGPVLIACGQEAAAFAELAEDLGAGDRLSCIDIRDRAGWGEGDPAPKMAALLAEALIPPHKVPLMDVASEGLCLIAGAAEVALPAAERLAPHLSVTVLLTDVEVPESLPDGVDLATGRIARVEGALGCFRLSVERFAALAPAGRGPRRFDPPAKVAETECDILLDLTGAPAMVPAPQKRDGYLRADPADPLGVERAIFEAAQLTGTFEKPLHIRVTPSLCAHSRAGQVGCTRCLDLCPTSAIRPDGDHVRIDPNVCAGCGACAAACPSGAVASDDPAVGHLFRRLRVLAETYAKAGGVAPRLLVHDDHGAEMIRLAARFGRGLPASVIPFAMPSLGTFGHAEQLAALAVGFAEVAILPGPRTEREPILAQIALAQAVANGTGRLRLIDEADPDALVEDLHASSCEATGIDPILPIGGRRETTRLAGKALNPGATAPLPLPAGAPYGAVLVDTGKCTLCLSCVGLCPSGALGDNPDRPELNFREEACLQCGICATICPETAIRLVPQLDLSDAALRPRELNAEEPFCCIECGAPFGVRSTVEKIVEKLSAHAMFVNSDNARLIQMCDDCRVRAQYHSEAQPFALGRRPAVRTTEDYLNGNGEDA